MPMSLDKNGYVSDWYERIILEPLQIPGSPAVTSDDEGPDIDFDVSALAAH